MRGRPFAMPTNRRRLDRDFCLLFLLSEDWIGDSALSIHHNTPKVYLAIWRTLAKIPGPNIGWPTTNEPLQPPNEATWVFLAHWQHRFFQLLLPHAWWTKELQSPWMNKRGGLWHRGMDGGFPFRGRIRCHDFCVCFWFRCLPLVTTSLTWRNIFLMPMTPSSWRNRDATLPWRHLFQTKSFAVTRSASIMLLDRN